MSKGILERLQEELDEMIKLAGDLGEDNDQWEEYQSSRHGYRVSRYTIARDNEDRKSRYRIEFQSYKIIGYDSDEIKQEVEGNLKYYARKYHRIGLTYPGMSIERVPADVLGYGVLGRCFPYSDTGLIQIRNDLYGDDFTEVLTHELKHMAHPEMSEDEIRQETRRKLPFTPRFH